MISSLSFHIVKLQENDVQCHHWKVKVKWCSTTVITLCYIGIMSKNDKFCVLLNCFSNALDIFHFLECWVVSASCKCYWHWNAVLSWDFLVCCNGTCTSWDQQQGATAVQPSPSPSRNRSIPAGGARDPWESHSHCWNWTSCATDPCTAWWLTHPIIISPKCVYVT